MSGFCCISASTCFIWVSSTSYTMVLRYLRDLYTGIVVLIPKTTLGHGMSCLYYVTMASVECLEYSG